MFSRLLWVILKSIGDHQKTRDSLGVLKKSKIDGTFYSKFLFLLKSTFTFRVMSYSNFPHPTVDVFSELSNLFLL